MLRFFKQIDAAILPGLGVHVDEQSEDLIARSLPTCREGCVPMTEWSPADVLALIDFQRALNAELLDCGELVDAQGPPVRKPRRSWYPTAFAR